MIEILALLSREFFGFQYLEQFRDYAYVDIRITEYFSAEGTSDLYIHYNRDVRVRDV